MCVFTYNVPELFVKNRVNHDRSEMDLPTIYYRAGDDMENKAKNKANNEAENIRTYSENGECYSFDRNKLKNVFEVVRKKRGYTVAAMKAKLSKKLWISEYTITNHLRPEGQRCADSPHSIELAKNYGKFLTGDEYAFLLRLIPETQLDDWRVNAQKIVFDMLYDILALYETSDCFNYVPGTNNSDGAWSYFEGEIGKVRKRLETEFLGRRDSTDYQKLERIINETEVFIKSYEVPGVAKRWRKINHQINFFDCSFKIIDENDMKTARLLYSEGLLYYLPSYNSIKIRNAYMLKFAKDKDNLKYSEERIFQNELLRTLAMVFNNDFDNNDKESSRVA